MLAQFRLFVPTESKSNPHTRTAYLVVDAAVKLHERERIQSILDMAAVRFPAPFDRVGKT